MFDFGGVLTRVPGPEHWEALLAAIYGANSDGLLPALQAQYYAHRDDFDRGRLSAREYWAAVLSTLGVDAGEGNLLQRLFELDTAAWTRKREGMCEWAAGLRAAGVATGILSNMPQDVLERVEAGMHWAADFHPRVYSCRVGLVKPEAAIYRALLDDLDVPAESVLFLDDREENAQAARELGMAAERFVTLEQILPVVRERYGLPGLETRGGDPSGTAS